MSDEDGSKRPAPEGFGSWPDYWKAQGMPWRTEPEILPERQQYLTERRDNIHPDIEKGIYPFKDIKLGRGDVEWLLAMHENGRGPVDWDDVTQRRRQGLDLRGADLRGADLRQLDLSRLPLACLHAGLTREEWDIATPQQGKMAASHLDHADLSFAHLQGAHLVGVTLCSANLREAQSQGAYLFQADMKGANLVEAELQGAYLVLASLQGVSAYRVQLHGANLFQAQLQGADLTGARLDVATSLNEITLDAETRLADVIWNDTPLTLIPWEQAPRLGDESAARRPTSSDGKAKNRTTCLAEFHAAVRANRQLAVALRAQGLNEEADRFAYRAQLLQRQVLLRQRHNERAFGSWLLDLISGYGYKPMRSIITYLLVILSFAAAYFALTNFAITPFLPSHSSPLAWYEAIVLSISSFHGRGLFPSGLSLGDPIAILAAFEAIIGLLIEITFIATFTQRFFAR
jgi:uncharacterized protein YjbI with pentapeptide repeats